VTLDFFTENDITMINDLFQALDNVTTHPIYRVNRCGNNEIGK
jgi:hypothetical protein